MMRVYSKNGKIKLANVDNISHQILLEKGWDHTATIDPAAWIESICNGYGSNVDEMIDELHFGPIIPEKVA